MASPGGAPRRALTARDLAEEGKKRAVLLLVFAFGLAFLMSRESLSPIPRAPLSPPVGSISGR
jgi:sorting nexin-13